MSAYITLTISRRAAKAKLFELAHGRLSNERLADTLDLLLQGSLYNFRVIDVIATEDDLTLDRLEASNYERG
jgi:hypothetical protein